MAETIQGFGFTPSIRCKAELRVTHHGNGKRFVVRADEKLTAFLEIQSAIRVVSWY
jgi:hypothetical protein